MYAAMLFLFELLIAPLMELKFENNAQNPGSFLDLLIAPLMELK
ncbi:MAG: hypothetical protein PETM_02703 [Petrimonas sp.]